MDKIFKNVSFIVFNYDRCLEHFLYRYLKQFYGQDDSQAASILKSAKIVHPYGRVGWLPWQGREESVPFGVDINGLPRNRYAEIIKGIRTYTEDCSDTEEVLLAQDQVDISENIIFLDMAYHGQNMRLLKSENSSRSWSKKILGTAYGLPIPHQEEAKKSIHNLLAKHPKPEIDLRPNLCCNELLCDYGITLS